MCSSDASLKKARRWARLLVWSLRVLLFLAAVGTTAQILAWHHGDNVTRGQFLYVLSADISLFLALCAASVSLHSLEHKSAKRKSSVRETACKV